MRKSILLIPAVVLGLFAALPPVGAQEAADAGAGGGTVPGFATIATHAQGQAATGYFFNVGNEENRLVGALSAIATPPASSTNVAALVQRGVVASFIYGMAGGGGPGKAGALPDPPPGEAAAYFPAEPQEARYQGPVTTGANGPVVDGRFSAKATDAPTGRADSAVSNLEVPDQLNINQAVVSSHTEPVEGGIAAESVSVLYGITLGPLQIETMVSRAYGFVPAAPGEPKAVATTVVDGATVNSTPVKVTEKGVVVGDQAGPDAQEQVNKALAEAGYSEVRLVPSSATPGEGNESVTAMTGTLRVVHRDDKMAQQFQGFAGGGFAVGGAEVRVTGRRCGPDCPSATGSLGELAPSLPASEPAAAAESAPAPAGSNTASAANADTGFGSTVGNGAGGASGAVASTADSYLSGSGPASSTSTTAVTPPSTSASLGLRTGSGGSSTVAAGDAGLSGAALALATASELNPEVARGLHDGLLVGAMALLGAVLLGARLVTR